MGGKGACILAFLLAYCVAPIPVVRYVCAYLFACLLSIAWASDQYLSSV